MGQGINLAKDDNPEHAEMIDNLKDQLLIAFVNRLGGKLIIPISELDKTGEYTLSFSIDEKDKSFNFETNKKN